MAIFVSREVQLRILSLLMISLNISNLSFTYITSKPCRLSLRGWKNPKELYVLATFWWWQFLTALPLPRPWRRAAGACRSRRQARGWPPSRRGWGSAASFTPSESARSPSTGWWITWPRQRARCKRPARQRLGYKFDLGTFWRKKRVGSVPCQVAGGFSRSLEHNYFTEFLRNQVLASCFQCFFKPSRSASRFLENKLHCSTKMFSNHPTLNCNLSSLFYLFSCDFQELKPIYNNQFIYDDIPYLFYLLPNKIKVCIKNVMTFFSSLRYSMNQYDNIISIILLKYLLACKGIP